MEASRRVSVVSSSPPYSLQFSGSILLFLPVVFILERSEFELFGNGYAGTALRNGCGPEQICGGDAKLGTD